MSARPRSRAAPRVPRVSIAPPCTPAAMDDPVVASHADVVLRESDVASIRGKQWLTDAVLSFYTSWLSDSAPESVLLIDASVSFFLASCAKDDVSVVATPLRLASRELVLCPVSDNSRPEQAYGGTHWALLAFWRERKLFKLFDSQSAASSPCAANAQTIARALAVSCNLPDGPQIVEDGRAPRQVNSHDCALHALLTAEALAGGAENADSVTPQAAAALRLRLLELVEELAGRRAELLFD